jgi:NAD-dependent deacetylase
MPEDAMRRASELAQNCDLFVVLGSSLVVYPAAGFPVIARRRGAKLAIVNREPTELDEIAHLTLHTGIGPTLKAAISAL